MVTEQNDRRLDNLGAALYRAERYNETALVDLGGQNPPNTFSFREIDTLANAVARGLLARGHKRGQHIVILSANRMEFLVSYIGTMRAGLVSVPLNFKLPATTLHYMLRDCDARLAFCDRERAEFLPPGFPRVEFDGAGENGFSSLLNDGDFDPVSPQPREPAMFLYTSGSSGIPKGVILSHESHLWVLQMRHRLANSIERVLIAAPLYHMNALGTSHAALFTGNCVVLMPGFNVPAYIDAIEQYGVTWITAVPPMVAMLLQRPDLLQNKNLSSVRLLRMGSAPVSQKLIDATQAVFPGAAVSNVYGTTEAGPITFGPHPEGIKKPSLSVGYPMEGVEMRLTDENGRLSDDGVLEMKCPALMTGYHNQPESTRKVMSGDGFFITGDLFHRDRDGFYFFVGRADDMFVCGGENVYPGEVEKVLEQYPGIHQACVVPLPDEIKGMKPVAFVVARAGAHLNEEKIKEYVLEKAAPYLHPRRVWFVDQLPLAGTNKIDRDALKQMAADRAADSGTAATDNRREERQ